LQTFLWLFKNEGPPSGQIFFKMQPNF
jgi:hypothetical protein